METEEAVHQLEDLNTFYTQYEELLSQQHKTLEQLVDIENQLSMFYFQWGHQMNTNGPDVSGLMLHLGEFMGSVRARETNVLAQFVELLKRDIHMFKDKAIGDTLETFEMQDAARTELDGFAGRYYEVLKKLRQSSSRRISQGDTSTHSSPSKDRSGRETPHEVIELTGEETIDRYADEAARRQFERSRDAFLYAKVKYESLSQSLAEKVALLVSFSLLFLGKTLRKHGM